MLAIIDYGVGNLFSLSRSLDYLGVDCQITRSLAELKAAAVSYTHLTLPTT